MNVEKDFRLFSRDFGINEAKINTYMTPQNAIIEPYILEERQLNCQPMSVFSRLFYDRIIWMSSEVNSDSASIIKAQMLYLASTGDDDIKFYIDTCGGSVNAGLSVVDVMNFIKPNVQTYNMGLCASMGSILLSSGEKGKRYGLKHSQVMTHQVSSGTQGPCSDMEIAVREAKKLQNELYNLLSENTGQTIEQIAKDADRDHWFTSEEALEYGLIDKII